MGKINCSNCREVITEEDLKKVAIGKGRNVVFCAKCNCYLTIQEPIKAEKVEKEVPPSE